MEEITNTSNSNMKRQCKTEKLHRECSQCNHNIPNDRSQPNLQASFTLILQFLTFLTSQDTNHNHQMCSTCGDWQKQYIKECENRLKDIMKELQNCQSHYDNSKSSENSSQNNDHTQRLQQEILRLQDIIRSFEEQREHLGAQLVAYKEDFDNERADRERAHGKLAELQIELDQEKQKHKQQQKEMMKQLRECEQQLSQERQRSSNESAQIYIQNFVAKSPPPSSKPPVKHITPTPAQPGRVVDRLLGGQRRFDIEIDGKEAILLGRTASMATPRSAAEVSASAAGRYIRTAAVAEELRELSLKDKKHETEKESYSCETKLVIPRALYETDSAPSNTRPSVVMPEQQRDRKNGSQFDAVDGTRGRLECDSPPSFKRSAIDVFEINDADSAYMQLPQRLSPRGVSILDTMAGTNVNNMEDDVNNDFIEFAEDDDSDLNLLSDPTPNINCISAEFRDSGSPPSPSFLDESNSGKFMTSLRKDFDMNVDKSTIRPNSNTIRLDSTTVRRDSPDYALECPSCHMKFSTQEHLRLLDHMEYECMPMM